MGQSGQTAAAPRSGKRVWATGLVTAAVGGTIAWSGADREPADLSTPIVVRGLVGAAPTQTILRVGTYNIHSGRPEAGAENLNATAAVLRAADLDFIGLNEVAAGFQNDQADGLGTRLGMASVFVPTERRWWHGHFGNGILSRRPLGSILPIPLPGTQGKAFRNMVLTSVVVNGQAVRIVTTHLDRTVDRDRQLEVICDLFAGLAPPAILMGDFNTRVSHPTLAALIARPDVHDALTEQTGPAEGRIDHIFVRGLDCTAAALIESNASDHPHVWAELELPTRE